jgi:hypothetical protein
VNNERYRKGTFEIPCRAGRSLAEIRGRQGLPRDRDRAWMLMVGSLRCLVGFALNLSAKVRGWVASVNVEEPAASLTNARAHANQ